MSAFFTVLPASIFGLIMLKANLVVGAMFFCTAFICAAIHLHAEERR